MSEPMHLLYIFVMPYGQICINYTFEIGDSYLKKKRTTAQHRKRYYRKFIMI